MSSLRQLAEYLGLSITTVSRALDGYPDVSETTRERVRLAAKELNYVPNAAARRLRRGRSDSVALVLPPVQPWSHPPFFLDLIMSIAGGLARRGRELTILPSTGDSELGLYARIVEARSCDAAILLRPLVDDPRIAFLRSHKFPCLVFGKPPAETPCDGVSLDYRSGLSLITRRAWELGHRRIALIGGPKQLTGAGEREAGYRQTMDTLGLEPFVVAAGVDEKHGYSGANHALDAHPRPTALLCAGDRLASGAYRAIKERGLMPGSEVAVTGMTNLSWSGFYNPPLATLDWSIETAGNEIADVAVSLIEKKTEPGSIQRVLPMRLIERASLGPAPREAA